MSGTVRLGQQQAKRPRLRKDEAHQPRQTAGLNEDSLDIGLMSDSA